MDRWKSTARKKLRHGESQKGEDKRCRSSEKEKVRREKMQVCEKLGMSCGSRGSRSRLAKAAGAQVSGQISGQMR